MEYRTLGRTGVKVSPLCLGCMNFGGYTEQEESERIINNALDRGVNFLDTANAYNGGKSEEIIGEALKKNGKRNRVVLATKVHHPMDDSDPNACHTHRRHIIEQCEASLRRLQTDHIDLYQLHRPDPHIPIDESLRAMDDLVRSGKVRYIGTSSFPAWQLLESLWVSKEYGLNRVVTEQPPYNLLDRRIERELIPMAKTYGIALITWSPSARGFFSGKYQRGQDTPENSRFKTEGNYGGFFQQWIADHLSEESFKILDVVTEIANEKNCTPLNLAIAWGLSNPGITSSLMGPRTIEQLESYLEALDVKLDEEDHARLDKVSIPGEHRVPYYGPPLAEFGARDFHW